MNIVVSHQTMASTEETPVSCNIVNTNGFEFLATLDKNSIDLILTDPPYIISRDSGLNMLKVQVIGQNIRLKMN